MEGSTELLRAQRDSQRPITCEQQKGEFRKRDPDWEEMERTRVY